LRVASFLTSLILLLSPDVILISMALRPGRIVRLI